MEAETFARGIVFSSALIGKALRGVGLPNQEDWQGFGGPETERLRLSFCCSEYVVKQTGVAWTEVSEFLPQNVLSLFWSVSRVA